MKKPKVLIFGQSFNSNTGGGVTLSNLFHDWNKEDLAVIVTSHAINNINFSYCDNYFFIGNKENSWIFPFNFFQRNLPSGKIDVQKFSKKQEVTTQKPNIRSRIINNIFYPFLMWTGLFHVLSRIHLTDDLMEWVKEFNPDIVYIQVSTRDSLLFGKALAKELDIPVVLHQMDDWLHSISYGGLFSNYWKKKINNEFQELVDLSTLCLSISDLMGIEYYKRFGKKFVTYHNPVDLSFWNANQDEISLNDQAITVLYAGRTGFGIGTSLKSFAQAVEELNKKEGIAIEFYIQTVEPLSWIEDFEFTHYRGLVAYSKLPKLFRGANFLLLPCDFSQKSIEFLRYSMPTKAPEYMISGTPTVLLAPKETAVYQYGTSQKWAFSIDNDAVPNIKEKLKEFLFNQELQYEYSSKALKLAMKNHDSQLIRNRFLVDFMKLLDNNDLPNDKLVAQKIDF